MQKRTLFLRKTGPTRTTMSQAEFAGQAKPLFQVKKQHTFKPEYRGISDILNGMSEGRIKYGFGHDEECWKRAGKLEKESWAQFGRIQFENNKNVTNLFHELFPSLEKYATISLKGVF